jgi:hypothetical protein
MRCSFDFGVGVGVGCVVRVRFVEMAVGWWRVWIVAGRAILVMIDDARLEIRSCNCELLI